MKKIIIALTSVLFCVTLLACGELTSETTTVLTTTEMPILATPTELAVVDNIATFTAVDNAVKYKLFVSTEADARVGEYNITSGVNLLPLLGEGRFVFKIKAVASGYTDSPYSETVIATIADPSKVAIMEGETLNSLNNIRWIGRTYYDSTRSAQYFYFTASGFEVSFYGTELKVTMTATRYASTTQRPYVVVFVDGEEDPTKGTTLILSKAESSYTLVSGLTLGHHTVKLLKRSEASDSDTAVKKMETDGYFNSAPQASNFKIQYIAASSSTGYGNLGNTSTAKTTANSDGLRGFAYLTSYLLGAETNIFAASGWGVTRGWNTGGQLNAIQNIPAAYEYYAINDTNYVFTAPGEWDHSNFVPNVLVVNLGTNDFNASGYNAMTSEQKTALETKFIDDYTMFLRTLHSNYPNAVIIVAYGLMGDALTVGPSTLSAIANANTAIGSTICHAFVMEAAGAQSAYGSNGHPNVQTSMNVAEDLAALITTLTGRQPVRTMITNN